MTHGKWLEPETNSVCYYMRCSVCGTETRSCSAIETCHYVASYCPACGARMDSEGGDADAAD